MNESWKGIKALILGLGQFEKGSGVSAALFAARNGADVLATDLKSEKELLSNVTRLKKFKNVKFRLGEHRLEDIRWADVIVRNPRARSTSPEMKLASKLGKRVESDVSLFMQRCPCPVVGITGTRGKSTTSTLVAEMLKSSGEKVWLGGNILVSPLTFLEQVTSADVVVLELSSWLLETTGDVGISPRIACITNLMRDHLNSYEGMEDYGEAKAQIFRHQLPDDALVLNGDDAFCKSKIAEAPGNVLLFTKRETPKSSAWISGTKLMMRNGRTAIAIADTKKLHVSGEHIHLNMLAAALTARLAGASIGGIQKSLRQFRGLPDRQEVVAVKRGVTYINDTTASTPDGVIAALETFAPKAKTLRVIIGGSDKNLEFTALAKKLKAVHADVALLPGSSYAPIVAALQKAKVLFSDAADLREAFRLLSLRSTKGDYLLLSPGSTSFGQFANEFERGEMFRKLVRG